MGFLDVLHPQVGKGEALAFLQRRWDVAREETVAIGDNWNDREMLQAAGPRAGDGQCGRRDAAASASGCCPPTTRTGWRWPSSATCLREQP